jgi:hypothetical protein
MMIKMLRRALSLVLLAVGVLWAQKAQPLAMFRSVLEELAPQVKVPILLPRKLPFRAADIKLVRGDVRDDGYWISLHFSEDGNAGYAAGFGASTTLTSSRKGAWKLASGLRARFMPVSCGGSCAPANLWWVQDGVEYTIQLKMNVKTPEGEQARALIDIANSMSGARP